MTTFACSALIVAILSGAQAAEKAEIVSQSLIKQFPKYGIDRIVFADGERLEVEFGWNELPAAYATAAVLFVNNRGKSVYRYRVRAKTDAKVFHHSCGAVTKAADILVDAGVDILNSLQPHATGMNSTYLKDRYGAELAFHGGVDIQEVLPNGTVEDVEDEVKKRIAIWAPGGGYVFCAAHNIQIDVPPENLTAMYRAADEWGTYPLREELLELRRLMPADSSQG